MNNIVQNQDSGLTKYEYIVIMTSLIEILITILITSFFGVNEIFVIGVFSLIVVIINCVYWRIIKSKYIDLFK